MNGERPGDDRFEASVDHAWRQSSNETPPARVDESILAAARSEAARARGQEPTAPARGTVASRSPWPTSWQPLAVAAGIAGLAFALIQLMPAERDVAKPVTLESRQSEAPVGESAAAPSVPAASGVASNEIAKPAPAPARSDAAAARPVDTEAPPAAREAASATLAPTEWARRIRSLHEAGDVAGAEFELRAFRAEYPNADTYLPQALRAWSASVK